MERRVGDKAPTPATGGRGRRPQGGLPKLIQCPFEVWIDGAPCDRFYDVRDAIAAARAVKRDNPKLAVVVSDMRTRKLVVEIEA